MTGDGDDGAVAGSDSEAGVFEGWYRVYHDRILAQCVRLLGDRAAAEDIAQETLLRAWLGRERMREEDLGAWLSVVARNLCISHTRRQKKAVPTEVLPETADEGADPARVLERNESRRAVRRAMRQVGERHRVLLFRREVEGIDYDELGQELGLTPSGTRAVLFRARRVLRDRLAAVGEGLGAFVFGVRIKIRDAKVRVRGSFLSMESGAVTPAMHVSLNAAVAIGVTLATLGGGIGIGGGTVLAGEPAEMVARPAVVLARTETRRSNEDARTAFRLAANRSNVGGDIRGGGPQVPKPGLDPDPYNDDGSTGLIATLGDMELVDVGFGPDPGDGLGAIWNNQARVMRPICDRTPSACSS